MLKWLRIYLNGVLFRLRLRDTLPAYFINRVPVRESGEVLVAWQGGMVRSSVAERLDEACRLLPEGYSIVLREGFRSASRQRALRLETEERLRLQHPELTPAGLERLADRFCARRSGHRTGGAVDVELYCRNSPADCGAGYLEFSRRSSNTASHLSCEAAANRRLLLRAMCAAGFVNYPPEYWHFCYGDRMYAAYCGRKYAIYGELEQ